MWFRGCFLRVLPGVVPGVLPEVVRGVLPGVVPGMVPVVPGMVYAEVVRHLLFHVTTTTNSQKKTNSVFAYAYVILTNSPESGNNLKYLEASSAPVLVTLH